MVTQSTSARAVRARASYPSMKVIDHKVYFLFDVVFSRRRAVSLARKLRNGPDKWFVRVRAVPDTDEIQIWRR